MRSREAGNCFSDGPGKRFMPEVFDRRMMDQDVAVLCGINYPPVAWN